MVNLAVVARLKSIDSQLCKREGVTVYSLAEQLGVDPKTIRRDLDLLRGMGCVIEDVGTSKQKPSRFRHTKISQRLFLKKD